MRMILECPFPHVFEPMTAALLLHMYLAGPSYFDKDRHCCHLLHGSGEVERVETSRYGLPYHNWLSIIRIDDIRALQTTKRRSSSQHSAFLHSLPLNGNDGQHTTVFHWSNCIPGPSMVPGHGLITDFIAPSLVP